MASVAHSRSVCGNKQFPRVISKRNATSHFNPQTGPSINGGMASKKKTQRKISLMTSWQIRSTLWIDSQWTCYQTFWPTGRNTNKTENREINLRKF